MAEPSPLTALWHTLGVNPPGLTRDYANTAPIGLPTWSVTYGLQNLVTRHTPYFYGTGRGPSVQFVFTHNSLADGGVTDLFTISSEPKLMFGRR
jgi:hypothetical protein